MPQKAGDRGNTDRRDAVPWARLARSGALPPGSVPLVADDALHDLRRAREAARGALPAATFRRTAFLLRHDSRYRGRATGHPAPLRGLAAVVWAPPAPPIVFQDYVRAVNDPLEPLPRLAQDLQAQGKAGPFPPGVEARQALRGRPCLGAVPPGADRGALTRVENPRALMKCLGRIPSAYATGERRRQGAITTAGKPPARRALVDGAGASRSPAKGSRPLPRRRATPPKVIPAIRWPAQGRRGKRSRRLMARGTHANQVVVAMARALGGFLWAMATQVPVTP
jgi:hypothetical protein